MTMEQSMEPPQFGMKVVVTKGPGEPSVEVPVTDDIGPTIGVLMAQTEVKAWLRAIDGAVQQLVDECQMFQRDTAMLAVQRAINGFNEANAALVAQVYELEVKDE